MIITSFSTIFLSYQDDGRFILKAVSNETRLSFQRFPPKDNHFIEHIQRESNPEPLDNMPALSPLGYRALIVYEVLTFV